MTEEQKKRIMMADDLTLYIRNKHTQEECNGFIDGYEAALRKLKELGLPSVTYCGCNEYVSIHNREDDDECCKCGEKENNH